MQANLHNQIIQLLQCHPIRIARSVITIILGVPLFGLSDHLSHRLRWNLANWSHRFDQRARKEATGVLGLRRLELINIPKCRNFTGCSKRDSHEETSWGECLLSKAGWGRKSGGDRPLIFLRAIVVEKGNYGTARGAACRIITEADKPL